MKRIALLLPLLALAAAPARAEDPATNAETEDRYPPIVPVLAVGIFPPVQIGSEDASVLGVRLSLPYAKHAGVIGIDAGVVNDAGYLAGVQIGLVNLAEEFHGLQLGVFNYSEGDVLGGAQIGLFNKCDHGVYGLQAGLINFCNRLEGVQIGLINTAERLGLRHEPGAAEGHGAHWTDPGYLVHGHGLRVAVPAGDNACALELKVERLEVSG